MSSVEGLSVRSGRGRPAARRSVALASEVGDYDVPGGVQSPDGALRLRAARRAGSAGAAPGSSPSAPGAALACARRAPGPARAPRGPAPRGSGSSRSSNRPDRLDPDPALLEVALVLLRDPARGEVEDADDALEQQVLDAHLAQLLLEPLLQLLLARRRLALLHWTESIPSAAIRVRTCARVSPTASR